VHLMMSYHQDTCRVQLPDDILAPGAKEKLAAAAVAAGPHRSPDASFLLPGSRPALPAQMQHHNLSNVSCVEHFDLSTAALSDHALQTVKSDPSADAAASQPRPVPQSGGEDGPCVSLAQAIQAAADNPTTLPNDVPESESDHRLADGCALSSSPAPAQQQSRRRSLPRHLSLPAHSLPGDSAIEVRFGLVVAGSSSQGVPFSGR
jgi:hypothetical protein